MCSQRFRKCGQTTNSDRTIAILVTAQLYLYVCGVLEPRLHTWKVQMQQINSLEVTFYISHNATQVKTNKQQKPTHWSRKSAITFLLLIHKDWDPADIVESLAPLSDFFELQFSSMVSDQVRFPRQPGFSEYAEANMVQTSNNNGLD